MPKDLKVKVCCGRIICERNKRPRLFIVPLSCERVHALAIILSLVIHSFIYLTDARLWLFNSSMIKDSVFPKQTEIITLGFFCNRKVLLNFCASKNNISTVNIIQSNVLLYSIILLLIPFELIFALNFQFLSPFLLSHISRQPCTCSHYWKC
jgi:hypothetical protein